MFDLQEYLQELEYIVNIDSGSYHGAGTAQVAEFFRKKFEELGWYVQVKDVGSEVGPCLEIVNIPAEEYEVVFMGHMDTVFPVGTAAQRPFSLLENKAFGPGVNDMKAGLLLVYHALKQLHHSGRLQNVPVCVAFNSDEEISSKFSRKWLEELSAKSRHALVLEAARTNGNLVNRRKGVGRYKLEFSGRAAHSGVDHEKGCSALEELAHWILALHGKTNYETGTTVNVGLAGGGTAVNVVADTAKAEVDLRVYDLAATNDIETLMTELAACPRTPGVTVTVQGGMTRPPMNPSAHTLKLCERVEKIGADLGLKIGWTATGGGSDGSFAANLGVPTIDGLGPVGGGSHGPNEYLLLDTIEPRLNLLREFIADIVAVREK